MDANVLNQSVQQVQATVGYILLAVGVFIAFGTACFIWGNSR